jgi:hypothetical protein
MVYAAAKMLHTIGYKEQAYFKRHVVAGSLVEHRLSNFYARGFTLNQQHGLAGGIIQ